VPPADVVALGAAISGLLGDQEALAEARAGAMRAREELTWEAAAAAHLDLYREVLSGP
jgi:glycosyltransferase involved in cell wall biosynthesis